MSKTSVEAKLAQRATNLAKVPISQLPTDAEKNCFICVNTYNSYSLNLGTGPLNDAVTFAKRAKQCEFEVYYLHNPKSKTFLSYLDAFFQNTNHHLVVYYVGHGTNVRDRNGDEADGYDEAMVFDDGTIIDDVLVDHLIQYKKDSTELTLVTDACHSGSIWDLQSGTVCGRTLPPNVLSISAANDQQTAKQTMIDRMEQGVFTSNMCKIMKTKPLITPNELKTEMAKVLRKYCQTVTLGTTSPEMLNLPVFD